MRPQSSTGFGETYLQAQEFGQSYAVCQNYKSETGCKYGRTCFFRHVAAEGTPNERSKKGGAKGSVAILKESIQLGCASQDSYPKKSIQREPGILGTKHTPSNSPRAPGTKLKFGKERVHREELSKRVRLMSVVLACHNSERSILLLKRG